MTEFKKVPVGEEFTSEDIPGAVIKKIGDHLNPRGRKYNAIVVGAVDDETIDKLTELGICNGFKCRFYDDNIVTYPMEGVASVSKFKED